MIWIKGIPRQARPQYPRYKRSIYKNKTFQSTYEETLHPEIILDKENNTSEQCLDVVIQKLNDRGMSDKK